MSLSSTYLLALMVIVALAGTLILTACLFGRLGRTLRDIAMFLYCFFIGGLSLASAASTQGAFLNIGN